jgi:hypothetical protein
MPIPVKTSMRQSERGSVLILVVIAAMFVSLLVSVGLGRLKTQDDQDKTLITAKKQKFLVSELAAYAQRENRVPCPASAAIAQTASRFGFSIGSVPADPSGGGNCTAAGEWEGIVPFRTLGLSAYDVVDGWGNYLTYRVSPVSANPLAGTVYDTPAGPTNPKIFRRCRRFPWFDDGLQVYTQANQPYYSAAAPTVNVYPAKALFCCPADNASFPPGGNTDMKIQSSSGAGVINGITTRVTNASTSDGPINTLVPPPCPSCAPAILAGSDALPAVDGTQEVFAFAIISHGRSGGGAYLPGTGASIPMPDAGVVSPDKKANASPSASKPLLTIDKPMNLAPGVTYFDDLTVWRTQVGLMSELGSASCYIPWR